VKSIRLVPYLRGQGISGKMKAVKEIIVFENYNYAWKATQPNKRIKSQLKCIEQ
jgi:hypothetical protein